MDKRIRRTVIITITETWTIVWLPGNDPLPDAPTDQQVQTNTEEPPDETLPTTLTLAETAPPPLAADRRQQYSDQANSSTTRRRGKGERVRRPKGSRAKK